MNKKIFFGALIASGLIGITLIGGCSKSESELQPEAVKPETTETTEVSEQPVESSQSPANGAASSSTTPGQKAPATVTSTASNTKPTKSAPQKNSSLPSAAEVCSARPEIVTFETEGFEISICGRDGDIYYRGVDKKNSNSIVLPASYGRNLGYEDGYVAVNGNVTYVINESFLTVTENKKEILRQKVISISDPSSNAAQFCPDGSGGGRRVNYFETKNFQIYICDADGLFYHGISKKDSNQITVPVEAEEGTGYVATNGDYTYIVNGASLAIMKGDQVIQEENVLKAE